MKSVSRLVAVTEMLGEASRTWLRLLLSATVQPCVSVPALVNHQCVSRSGPRLAQPHTLFPRSHGSAGSFSPAQLSPALPAVPAHWGLGPAPGPARGGGEGGGGAAGPRLHRLHQAEGWEDCPSATLAEKAERRRERISSSAFFFWPRFEFPNTSCQMSDHL